MSRRELGVVEEVVVKNIVKRYRWFELRLKELRFPKGLNLIIGPNGSGKSTLLKIIAGFTYPKEGEVRYVLRGGDYLPPTHAYGLVGYVAEDVRLPNMRVWEILKYFSKDVAGLAEVTELLDLKPYLVKRYYELSSGYRKRVQLAIALLMGADVVIMDEPFSNVDVLMIKPLKQLIRELSKDKVVIVTSHLDLNLVPDTLTVLNQGSLVYHGPAEELMRGRFTFTIKAGEEVMRVSLSKLNEVLAKHGEGVEVINVSVEDTSEILQELITQPRTPPERRQSKFKTTSTL